MKPVVLQLNLSSAWGGMEMSTLKVAKHLKERGFKSAIVASKNSRLEVEGEKQDVPVHLVPPGDHFSLKATLALRDVIKESGAQVIMVHQLRNLWILRPALWGLPQVRVVGFARMFLRGIRKKDPVHRHLYGCLEAMIALNEPQRDALIPCLPVPKERYLVIPNGVDTEKFHPRHRSVEIRQREFGADEKTTVIGLVGRIDGQKGQKELIEAAGILKARFPNVKYLIVGEETLGEDGGLKYLQGRAKELGLQNQIVFLGQRTDTPALMASFDILAVPSYEEAFGNVTVEGMASGVAVVATNSGGTPALIKDGEWGKLVEPRSGSSLASGLEFYLVNLDVRRSHAEKARAVAVEKFSLPKVMAQIESVVLHPAP